MIAQMEEDRLTAALAIHRSPWCDCPGPSTYPPPISTLP